MTKYSVATTQELQQEASQLHGGTEPVPTPNDITKDINSPLRLFADDCLLYRVINSVEDINKLQEDLNKLSEWADTWQLKFNVSKCTVIRCTRSLSPLTHDYTLHSLILDISDQHNVPRSLNS